MKIPPELAHTGPIMLGPPADLDWPASYRSRRYMRDMPDPELRQRLRDVFRNFMTVNVAGKASPLPVTHRGHAYWRIRFVHVLEELALRFGPYPNGIGIPHGSHSFFPNPNSKRALAASQAIDRIALEGKLVLTKYGQFEYLQQTLLTGRLRISPASSFADPQHMSRSKGMKPVRALTDREAEIYQQLRTISNQEAPTFACPGQAAPRRRQTTTQERRRRMSGRESQWPSTVSCGCSCAALRLTYAQGWIDASERSSMNYGMRRPTSGRVFNSTRERINGISNGMSQS